ncbi:hypothetical protein [Propionibacterium sp.]|uniref:hypothetical protein n=1 Tax=Propionibacterium sp. TaxID=1977903 RepID=UPI00345E09F8
MKNASRIVTMLFGVLAALAGLEHGIGEALQGNVRPGGLMILSWPDSSFFAILGGEPAMTVVPNLLVSGILTILMSLVLLTWVVAFVHRRHGGWVLLAICAVLLLVGGGFGPPALGVIVGLAALRIHSSHAWAARAPRLRRLLASTWPWMLGCGVVAWLLLMPGMSLLAVSLGVDSAWLVTTTILCAFGTLLLSIFTGFARDARPRTPAATAAARLSRGLPRGTSSGHARASRSPASCTCRPRS